MSKFSLAKCGIGVHQFTLLPDDVYFRLAKHPSANVKASVACCVHTPSELFEILAQAKSENVITELAPNPMTPLPVLKNLLSKNGGYGTNVDECVHQNQAFIQGDSWQLTEVSQIRTALNQRKHKVLQAILQMLEAHQEIAEALQQLLNAAVSAHWFLEPTTLRFNMVKRGLANHDLMMATAWSWHWQDRLAVARSRLAPVQALEKLRNDGLPFIRRAAIQLRCG